MHRKQHILLIFTQYGRIACAPISAITPASLADIRGVAFAAFFAKDMTLMAVRVQAFVIGRVAR